MAKQLDLIQAYKQPNLIAVLLSGGLDSSTALYLADQRATDAEIEVHAISFDYGQRHEKELEAAAAICEELDVGHHVIDLSNLIPSTMLTDANSDVPNISYAEIQGVSPTYVPYRNGLMISAATAHLLGLLDSIKLPGQIMETYGHLYCGIHSDDAAGFAYPDCTPEWFGSQANAIFTGTYGRVRLIAPLLWKSKAAIVSLGDSLGVEFQKTWSCYKGEELHCGTCPTCIARKEAFATAGVEDPTDYQN